MTKQTNERAFQNFVKDSIKKEGSWVSQLHPGLGSDIGIPDLITATESVNLLPMELKIGSIEDNKILWSSAIRPSQIAWHVNLTSHGYPSSILVGVPVNKTWRIFIVDGSLAAGCRDGWLIGKDARELDVRFFTTEIDAWADDTFNYSYE